MSNELSANRRQFLSVLGFGVAAAAAPNALVAQRVFSQQLQETGGGNIQTMRFRMRNRFAENGASLREISFTVRASGDVVDTEMAAWVKNNPLMENVRLPPGFRLVSSEISVDSAGRELSARLEMVEVSPTVYDPRKIG